MMEVQEVVNEYMKKEEVERHRLEQLDRRIEEARAESDELRRFKGTRGGVDAAKIHFRLMAKRVSPGGGGGRGAGPVMLAPHICARTLSWACWPGPLPASLHRTAAAADARGRPTRSHATADAIR